MSLTLSGMPDRQKKRQSKTLCLSVYSPATALESLSSVALSSGQAKQITITLQNPSKRGVSFYFASDHRRLQPALSIADLVRASIK
jgi:hypothetical protein